MFAFFRVLRQNRPELHDTHPLPAQIKLFKNFGEVESTQLDFFCFSDIFLLFISHCFYIAAKFVRNVQKQICESSDNYSSLYSGFFVVFALVCCAGTWATSAFLFSSLLTSPCGSSSLSASLVFRRSHPFLSLGSFPS